MSCFLGFLIAAQLFSAVCGQQISTCSLPSDPPGSLFATSSSPKAGTAAEAEEISGDIAILVNGRNNAGMLADGAYWSKKKLLPEDQLTVESGTPFSNLYITWESIPGPYILEWDGGQLECGQHGFLHEYICLPEAVTGLRFVFAEYSERVLCDIRLFTQGSPPEDVQLWLPPCEEADILAFPTHSDDDVLFFGPLLCYYAIERELTVQTAFMVNHYYEPHRSHERLDGLWEMGIRHYPILGAAPDTGVHDINRAMEIYAPSNIEQWQVELIRRFKPLVIIGHDLKGEYGNGGHKVNSYFLTRAVESAEDPEAFPASAFRYGTWSTPKLYLHLYPEHEIVLDVDIPLTKDPEGRTSFQIASDAFMFHPSQNQHGLRVQQKKSREYDCRPFGLYRTLVGYDTSTDIMEHIREEFHRMPRQLILPAMME